jgi:hypothetical protein
MRRIHRQLPLLSIIPKNYQLLVFAIDGDSDRPGDQQVKKFNFDIEILDDDVTPPQITIFEEVFGWSFYITDEDGYIDSNATGIYKLYDTNGSLWDIGIIEEEGKLYYVKIPFRPGNYILQINATNNDLEWLGDEEILVQTEPKNITLEYCFLFVDQKIEDLKTYVDNHLHSILASLIRCKLKLAQYSLRDAFELLMEGDLTSSLFKDAIAQALLKITEFETWFFDKINLIDENVVEFIISSLEEIRNFIILIMGNSVDYIKQIDIGYEIAQLDVALFDLKDYLYNQIGCWSGKYLRMLISMAACQLESTFFKLSMDMNISYSLSLAQYTLNLAENEVEKLLNYGKIDESIANYIFDVISNVIQEIDKIKEKI